MTIPSYAYISILIFSLCGLVWLDYRAKLALFDKPKITAKILAITVGFFLLWDIIGIILGIFATNSQFVIGIYFFTPNLPSEELLLLTLIAYLTLLLTIAQARWRK